MDWTIDPTKSDDDILAEAWNLYQAELSERDNADYYINKEQMQKVIRAHKFFYRITKEHGGHIDMFNIVPKEISAGITTYCNLFFFDADDVHELSKILSDAVSLSIDSTLDGEVCISFTIPNVYLHK